MQDKKERVCKHLIPLDLSNSSNPYLLTYNKDELLIRDGNALTAEYIWSLQGNDRDNLVNWVYNYYSNNGFPIIEITNRKMLDDFNKLCNKKDLNKVLDNGQLKNSSTLCLDILRYFSNELFYLSKREKATSVIDIFNDEEKFKNVLRNRMGYFTSKEDGTERPMIFGINDKMIIQGIRNSGNGSIISQFKPLVAKYIYNKYCRYGDKVFDYSSGWGARLLGALSLNLEYYGVDPLTYNSCNKLIKLFSNHSNSNVIKGCSENKEVYKNIPEVDFIFSSPPYFSMEIYSNEESQSYIKYSNYEDWLKKYWEQTIINCKSILKHHGYLGLVMIDKYGKYELAKDMNNIITSNGFELIEVLPMKTGKSHLTNKKENGINKVNDVIYIFRLI